MGSRDLVFGFFLVIRGMLLRRMASLRSGCLPLPGRLLLVERHGVGYRLRVTGFGGSQVDVVGKVKIM